MQNSELFRPIRSFIRRQGRITPGQEKAFQRLWPKYGLEQPSTPLNFNQIFPTCQPVILEIGFGNGESLAEMARMQQDKNFIGIEVHRPGIGHLMIELEKHQLSNVRVISADALEVMEKGIAPNSLHGIHLFFPDPWHKKRHHKRRIVNPPFLQLAKSRIQPNGFLHCATDWENYAFHMLEQIKLIGGFTNKAGEDNFSPRPKYRPLTKFERRGLKLGHEIRDLLFINTLHNEER